jgi:hypothetical protein
MNPTLRESHQGNRSQVFQPLVLQRTERPRYGLRVHGWPVATVQA